MCDFLGAACVLLPFAVCNKGEVHPDKPAAHLPEGIKIELGCQELQCGALLSGGNWLLKCLSVSVSQESGGVADGETGLRCAFVCLLFCGYGSERALCPELVNVALVENLIGAQDKECACA